MHQKMIKQHERAVEKNFQKLIVKVFKLKENEEEEEQREKFLMVINCLFHHL